MSKYIIFLLVFCIGCTQKKEEAPPILLDTNGVELIMYIDYYGIFMVKRDGKWIEYEANGKQRRNSIQ